MKNLLLIIAALTVTVYASAQKSFEVGLSGGIANYYGDLGNEELFQTKATRPGMQLTLRNFLGRPKGSAYYYRAFNVETRLSWHRLGYDETSPIGKAKGFELRNYGRGINFRTDVFGASGIVTYTYYGNRLKPLYMQSAALYFFTGAGMFYGKPKADLFRGNIDMNNRYFFWRDGTIRDADETSGKGNIVKKDGKYETNLADWKTEGQGVKSELGNNKQYCYYHIGIPLGMGFKYGLNKKTTLSFEVGWYMLMTDFIDDVSDEYATYAQIENNYPDDPNAQQIAKYISDPTGYGTAGYPSPATSRRGNPGEKDSYSFINLDLSYRFEFLPKKLFSSR